MKTVEGERLQFQGNVVEIFKREILRHTPFQQRNSKQYNQDKKQRAKENKEAGFAHSQSMKKQHGRKRKRMIFEHEIT